MTGPELNAPAVSFATTVAGAATVLSYIPAVFGGISSVIGTVLACYLVRNQILKNTREKLEIEKLKKEIREND
jgi:hypothetical protein